jgi:hypothetical protein
MQDRELYQEILGLKSPWSVSKVTLNLEQQQVNVLWRRMRSRRANGEMWGPEIDELFERLLFLRRGPRRVEQMREVATSVLEGYRRSFDETVTRRGDEAFNRIAIAEKHDKAFRHDLSAQGTQLRLITRENRSRRTRRI